MNEYKLSEEEKEVLDAFEAGELRSVLTPERKKYLQSVAEETFKKVIEQEPEYGPVYYSLALLYAELNRTDDAIEQLKNASKLMPDNTRVYYNLSLLYNTSLI